MKSENTSFKVGEPTRNQQQPFAVGDTVRCIFKLTLNDALELQKLYCIDSLSPCGVDLRFTEEQTKARDGFKVSCFEFVSTAETPHIFSVGDKVQRSDFIYNENAIPCDISDFGYTGTITHFVENDRYGTIGWAITDCGYHTNPKYLKLVEAAGKPTEIPQSISVGEHTFASTEELLVALQGGDYTLTKAKRKIKKAVQVWLMPESVGLYRLQAFDEEVIGSIPATLNYEVEE